MSIDIKHQITCSSFNEPIQIALFQQHSNSSLICDNNTLLIVDNCTGDLIHKIDTHSLGIKTIKSFTIGLQDEIIIGNNRIHVLSYEGKYLRQISSRTEKQIVDVDVHVANQPPDLIPAYHQQQPIRTLEMKSTKISGGKKMSSNFLLLILFFLSRIVYSTLCR